MGRRDGSGRVRLSLFYAALFATVGIVVPFFPVWLRGRGLGDEAIGWVLAAATWVRVLATPGATRVADTLGQRRGPIVVLALLGCGFFALFDLAGSLASFVFLAALAHGAFAPLTPLADSVTLRQVATRGVDYGRVRLWGSIGFIVAAVGAGELLRHHDSALVLWLICGGLASVALTGLALPPASGRAARDAAVRLRDLAARPDFLLFLATAGAVQASHAVYYAFGTLHWRAAGHSETVVGLLWGEGVVAEVLLFWASRRFAAHARPSTLLAFGGAAALIRFATLAVTTELAALAAVQLLHAFTFGAAHLGAMRMLADRVPDELSASAQGVYSVTVFGVAMGLAMPVAGALYDAHQGGAYLFGATLGAVGLVLALLLRAVPADRPSPPRSCQKGPGPP